MSMIRATLTREHELFDAAGAALAALDSGSSDAAGRARSILSRALAGTFYTPEERAREARAVADAMVALECRR